MNNALKYIIGAIVGAVIAWLVFGMDSKDAADHGGADATRNSATGGDGTTLAAVKERGHLVCGVSQGLPGFSSQDDDGKWTGLDVDYCRAVAVAIFGDGSDEHVQFSSLSAKARFAALTSGEIDILSRNTTWTFERDNSLGIDFVGVIYYDGQGFMVPKDLGITSAFELSGSDVCVNTGTTTELNLADFFRSNNMTFGSVAYESSEEVINAYDQGRCQVYTTDRSGVASERTKLVNPDDHMVLPEIISKEPLGPAVRHGDAAWEDLTRWTLNALITAEELGVTSANVDSMSTNSSNPEVKRLLGTERELGAILGLDKDWAHKIIKQLGNYGEIYDRNVGPNTPLALERGVNALWTDGGILYSPPVR